MIQPLPYTRLKPYTNSLYMHGFPKENQNIPNSLAWHIETKRNFILEIARLVNHQVYHVTGRVKPWLNTHGEKKLAHLAQTFNIAVAQ